ncbi:MAG: ABC transporter ATP-binding protein [Spirochaetia bacterium]|nr:ABC transporter ATP-binding protein [Spirochaetota bacterium]MCX8096062.1 ABC transporter ATP-binding protein [Spirochaetota bacterium]MDW8113232.1 ABC transporter ATP-binding protein [Spirochaetia bacterium]
MKVAVEFDRVSFGYDKNNNILNEVSLKIYESEFITVVGPNGTGKTTFVKLILGILKPNSGNIKVYGLEPMRFSGFFGYIPQVGNFDVQFPISVEEVVIGGLVRPLGIVSNPDRKRVEEILKRFGLYNLRKQHFFSLSGGQQQKTLLARALVSSPPILILDEPSSNIDVKGEGVIFEILSELKGSRTIIVITHDTGFVNNLTDRTFCVNNGSIVEHNSRPDEALALLFGHSKTDKKVIHGE